MRIEVSMLPPPALSPNSRAFWAEKYKASEMFGNAVYYSVINAINRAPFRPLLPLKKPSLNLTFIFARSRRRDKDNLVAMFKPGLDALVRAGLIEDDDAKHLELGEVRVEVDKGRAPLTVIELEEISGRARKVRHR